MNKKLEFTTTYTSISKVIDQKRDSFIPQLYGKVRTLDFINIQGDISYKKEVGPLVDSQVYFYEGSCPNFTDGATTSIASVEVETCLLNYPEAFCLDDMKQYFDREMARGSIQDSLPLEEQFFNTKDEAIAKKLDGYFFLGNGGCVTGVIPQAISGGATSLTASSIGSTPWAVASAPYSSSDSNAFNTVKKMVESLNSDYLDAEDEVLFVSRANFNAYVDSLVALNLFHYNPELYTSGVCAVVGRPNIKLVATSGLTGSNKAILHRGLLLIWGTDLNPSESPIDAGYERLIGKYVTIYKIRMGTGVGFASKAVVVNI